MTQIHKHFTLSIVKSWMLQEKPSSSITMDISKSDNKIKTTCNIWNNHIFGLCPPSSVLKRQCFGNWICFRPQVTWWGHLLCCVRYKELTSVTGLSYVLSLQYNILYSSDRSPQPSSVYHSVNCRLGHMFFSYIVQGVHKVLAQILTLITLDVNMIETHCKRHIKA
jgi:hypothetical protein